VTSRFHKGMKKCYACKQLAYTRELFEGKFHRLYCSKCISKKENMSSRQNHSLYINYILQKMGCDMND